MRISNVSAYGLSSRIIPPKEFEFDEGTLKIHKRDVILVVIETATGECGIAPCGTGAVTKWEEFSEATHDDIAGVINEIISPKLEGKTFEDIDELRMVIKKENLPKYLRWQAISVIDIAFHDILGKQTGTPVYEMLTYDIDPTPELDLYA